MLTKKRQRFAKEYVLCLNGAEAARKAGYSPKNAGEEASRLLANVSVKAVIDDELQKKAQKYEITEGKIKEWLIDIQEKTDNEGNRLRAIELLGKSLGLFKDNPVTQVLNITTDPTHKQEYIKHKQSLFRKPLQHVELQD